MTPPEVADHRERRLWFYVALGGGLAAFWAVALGYIVATLEQRPDWTTGDWNAAVRESAWSHCVESADPCMAAGGEMAER